MKYCVKESEKFDDVFICEYNSLLRILIKDMPGKLKLDLSINILMPHECCRYGGTVLGYVHH